MFFILALVGSPNVSLRLGFFSVFFLKEGDFSMHPKFEHLHKRTNSIENEIMSILKFARRFEIDGSLDYSDKKELKHIRKILIDVFTRLNDI